MFHRCNDIVLHGRRRGDRAKPLIVLSNALGTDARIWDLVLPFLEARYDILTYDKRGHGLSDAPRGPYKIADHAADLLALIDIIGERRFALVGLSVGGMIAQWIAAHHPDRVAALVLCNTGAKLGTADIWDGRIETAEYKGMSALAEPTLERWFTRAYREAEKDALQGWRNMLTRQPAGGYAATCAAIRDADLRDVVGTIQAPTLCVAGDQDLSVPADQVRATADLIPGARFATIEGAGHIPCAEQPETLAGLILDHLQRAGYAP